MLAHLDGTPVGLLQRCRLADYPEYLVEVATLVEVPSGAMTMDYLIGEPQLIGRGIGPRMIRSALQAIWDEHPDAPCVLVPVSAANRASWRALEKAGMVRVAEGELEPDNPVDGRAHYLYRVDRP
ncbi:GNAT family N-acetyltransferase [Streptomyces cyaneofuscatus]|uniref:GNAT family N-acetyltransferase n=1 Tax=Streptomyces cyaneofuscatus TaxID=66883 RepID=UPI0036859A27